MMHHTNINATNSNNNNDNNNVLTGINSNGSISNSPTKRGSTPTTDREREPLLVNRRASAFSYQSSSELLAADGLRMPLPSSSAALNNSKNIYNTALSSTNINTTVNNSAKIGGSASSPLALGFDESSTASSRVSLDADLAAAESFSRDRSFHIGATVISTSLANTSTAANNSNIMASAATPRASIFNASSQMTSASSSLSSSPPSTRRPPRRASSSAASPASPSHKLVYNTHHIHSHAHTHGNHRLYASASTSSLSVRSASAFARATAHHSVHPILQTHVLDQAQTQPPQLDNNQNIVLFPHSLSATPDISSPDYAADTQNITQLKPLSAEPISFSKSSDNNDENDHSSSHFFHRNSIPETELAVNQVSFLDPVFHSSDELELSRNRIDGEQRTGREIVGTLQETHEEDEDEYEKDENEDGDEDEEKKRPSKFSFLDRSKLDFDSIAQLFSHDSNVDSEVNKTSWNNISRNSSKRREARRQHGEYYYEQLTSRFMFHSDAISAIRSSKFETLPFATFSTSVADILRAGPFWIDVCCPTADEMNTLTRLFKIHPLTTEDIQTEDTREKCEAFPNYYFITIRTFDSDQYSSSYMMPINVYIVVFKECVLSPIVHLDNVLRRIEQLKIYGQSISPEWLNYALIDDITDGFMPSLRYIELEVDAIDELVLILKEREQSDMLRRIGHARKRVMMLLRLLITKADVIRAVIKRSGQRLSPESETALYLGDIQDHIITMVQNLTHCEKTLTRSHSNYLAQISIEITQASNRTNDVVMRMTALASILVPLNVITGIWGMNVRVPGAGEDNLAWFFGIVFVMLLVASVSWIVIRRFHVKYLQLIEQDDAIFEACHYTDRILQFRFFDFLILDREFSMDKDTSVETIRLIYDFPARRSTTQKSGSLLERSTRIPPSLIEGSVEKAVYYDAVTDAIASGVEESRAFELGHHARARAKEIHERIRQRAAEERDRQEREASNRIQQEKENAQEIQRTAAVAAAVAATADANSHGYKINSSILTSKIMNATPRWPDDIHAPTHPHMTPLNRHSFSNLLKKIVTPAVRMGIREARSREMLIAYRTSIESIEKETVEKLKKEWEQRSNHAADKARIEKLERENTVLKEQTLETMTLNTLLQREIDNLRRDSSSFSEENAILLSENARRRLQCSAYRRKINALKSSTPSHIFEPNTNESAIYESSESDEQETRGTKFCANMGDRSSQDCSQEMKKLTMKIGKTGAHNTLLFVGQSCTNYSENDDEAGEKLKQNWLEKVHAKCKREISRLREIIDIERLKRKTSENIVRTTGEIAINSTRVSQIVNILEDCLKYDEKHGDKCRKIHISPSTLDEAEEEEFSECISVRFMYYFNDGKLNSANILQVKTRRAQFVHKIQIQEYLLRSLLSTLNLTDLERKIPGRAQSASITSATATGTIAELQPSQKLRPSSASSRASIPGIKSIQVLLAEIPPVEEEFDGSQAKKAEIHGAFVQSAMRGIYLEEGDGSKKPRPQSTPVRYPNSKRSSTMEGPDMNFNVVSGISIERIPNAKSESGVDKSNKKTQINYTNRWTEITGYQHATRTKRPMKSMLAKSIVGTLEKRVAGTLESSGWRARPVDYTAGPHYGNL
ncbi:CorA metal ion transporter [Physocladia obscura]|uniref:CorA metal ion transporter n=1 Tax=Physocladia obscura TaxID=109957 RepID=A0AAD5XGJ5_9FUNG|nr:CorA metal ion transporter [Physocladia obscura]